MELSIHNWMRAEPVETTIRRIAQLGYTNWKFRANRRCMIPKRLVGFCAKWA